MPLELSSFLASFAFKKVADASFQALTKNVLGRRKLQLQTNFADVLGERMSQIATEVSTWSHQLEFIQPQDAKDLARLYIDLDLFVEPVADLPEYRNKKRKIRSILKESLDHIVILGRPGAGKTTTLKAIANAMLHGQWSNKRDELFPVPLVIRLREKDSEHSIYRHILDILAIHIFDANGETIERNRVDEHTARRMVHSLLNEIPLVLLIDGFDEIRPSGNAAQFSAKDRFAMDFGELCMNVKRSLLVLTSRTADFNVTIPGAHRYEISRLSEQQVKRFISKYFQDTAIAERVNAELIEKKLLGAEFIPLTLTYMCIVYRKYGRIFNSRRELYNRIIDLMLEEWDNQRLVRRSSSFEKFDSYDKKRFLRQLSYSLTTEVGGYYFSTSTIRDYFDSLVGDYEGLKKGDFYAVLQEIETHTGLLVKAGDGYMFSHRTIQEYLCAMYLYEIPVIPDDLELLVSIPNELALATSFNENATLYLSYLVLNRFWDQGREFFEGHFFAAYFDRLRIERPAFKIHPYLGLSALALFTSFVSVDMERDLIAHHDRNVSKFFSFIESDEKLTKSIGLLSEFYRVDREVPEKGVVLLRKKESFTPDHGFRSVTVDPRLRYKEPEKILCSYHFLELFGEASP
ncbi:NACHT domain-containing protein [Bradyrhizobium sp. ORS 375]|uniref:NACHT domain-containing protein n=1 Tax=Bradyrhizobium sp. (strain ORS 375) TaxID=566679 RepID=UPI00054EFC40|nr:NACHT domain-containing protein [Bradyrhizobium sp. ORS 375]